MPAISVIVPVYKVEPYLRRCVDSILSQTFTDFELILVDDGSPDQCPEICDEYAKKDKRVYVIHQKNGGLSAARNAGLDYIFENSNSKWVTFIDSDDWVDELYLEALHSAVTEYDTQIAISRFISVNTEMDAEKPDLINCKNISPEEFYVLDRINAIIACGKLFNKSCFYEMRFPVGKIHEDEFVIYRILFLYSRISVIDSALYYYYVNESGITKKSWTIKKMDAVDAHNLQLDFFKQNHYRGAYKCTLAAQLGTLSRFYLAVTDRALKKQFLTSIRWLMIKNIIYFNYCVKNAPWSCELAFPHLMRIYWPVSNRVMKLFKQNSM